jgi:hypothetical protein
VGSWAQVGDAHGRSLRRTLAWLTLQVLGLLRTGAVVKRSGCDRRQVGVAAAVSTNIVEAVLRKAEGMVVVVA